jgi:hypothetical protein
MREPGRAAVFTQPQLGALMRVDALAACKPGMLQSGSAIQPPGKLNKETP